MFFKDMFFYFLEGFTGAIAATIGYIDLAETGVIQIIVGFIVFLFFILGFIIISITILGKMIYLFRWKVKPFLKRRNK